MIVYIIGKSQNAFETDPNQKIAPKGPKIAKREKSPNFRQIDNKRCGCTFTQSIMQLKSFSKSAF